MDIVQDITEFAVELHQLVPDSIIECSPLPSGLTYLHVRVNRRCFVMAYYPRENGIGVDEVLSDEGFEMGYRNWFTDFSPAKEKLLSMVDDAIQGA